MDSELLPASHCIEALVRYLSSWSLPSFIHTCCFPILQMRETEAEWWSLQLFPSQVTPLCSSWGLPYTGKGEPV